MSGTPRAVAGIVVLPAGRTFWNNGRAKTWLNPPPAAIQPTSRTPGLVWHCAGGDPESTASPVFGSVHRYVPPTPVTSGSDAGHHTAGKGNGVGFLTGTFGVAADPESPEAASMVTPCARAASNAWRRLRRQCVLLKDF